MSTLKWRSVQHNAEVGFITKPLKKSIQKKVLPLQLSSAFRRISLVRRFSAAAGKKLSDICPCFREITCCSAALQWGKHQISPIPSLPKRGKSPPYERGILCSPGRAQRPDPTMDRYRHRRDGPLCPTVIYHLYIHPSMNL
jgi:hypothetical protein